MVTSPAVSWLFFKARAKRRYLHHNGRASNAEKQPTGPGPEGCVENGSAASLLVSHVSIQICSFLPPRRRPILNTTKPKGLRRRCTSLTAKNPERQHNENRRQRRDDRACDCGGKRQANDTGRNRTTTHRATRGKCSMNCTNPHTTATRCLPYRTTHSYLPRSSQPDSSAGTHRYSLRSRSSLAVRFQSLLPLRNNYRLRAAAATSCPTDKALSWSFSRPAYSRVQNPIRLRRSIPGRSVACSAYPRAAPQNRALASSAMRKTHLHRPSLRLRPDPSVLG